MKKQNRMLRISQLIGRSSLFESWALLFLLSVGVAVFMFGTPAQQESRKSSTNRRRALIVANGRYNPLPPVQTSLNDAELIKQVLESLGFIITVEPNLSNATAKRRIEDFVSMLNPSDVVLVYFVGHAAQEEAENYLLPIDYDPKNSPEDIAFHAYSVSLLLENLDEKKPSVKILVLDACRPIPGSWSKEGLASVTPGPGTEISFACATSTTVRESRDSPTSLFARSFKAAIEKPGLTVPQIFDDLSASIVKQTGRPQPFTVSASGLTELRFREAPDATQNSRNRQGSAGFRPANE